MARALAPILVLALAFVGLGRWRSPGLSRAERWVLAPAVGLGGTSILFFWWRLAGLPAESLSVPLFAVALLLAVVRPPRSAAGAREPAGGVAGRWLLGAAIALALAVCVLRLLQQPLGEYDAVAIWNARALTIWRAHEPVAPLFARLTASQAHPDYPLLLPAGIAACFSVAGGESVLVPQVVSVLWLLAAAGAVWIGVRTLAGPQLAPPAAALFLVTPEVLFWGPAQCADLPLACLLALAALGLARELDPQAERAPAARALLTGYLLSLLPWAKNEGLLLLGLVTAVWLGVGRASRRLRRERLLPLGLGALPGLATVVAFKLLWSPHAELADFLRGVGGRLLDPARWRTVAAAFGAEANPLGAGDEWSLTALLLLALGLGGWLAGRTGDPRRRFLRLALAGSLALWIAVYLGTPADLAWHLDTSLDRLLLQLLPLAFVWAFAEVGAAGASTPREAGDS